MTAVHRCPDCRCSPDEQPPPPATSSPGIRRAAIEQTRAEVRRAKEQRTVKAKEEQR